MKEIKNNFAGRAEMYRAAARYLAAVLQDAVTEDATAPFSLVLTGGSTPQALYSLLAAQYRHLPWAQVHFFWGDERYVSPTAAASNFKMAYDSLLSHLDLKPEQLHRIPTELPAPAQAAAAYEKELTEYFFARAGLPRPPAGGAIPAWPRFSFKLMLLGMGPDGHIASLFPCTEALGITDKLVTQLDKAPLPPQVPRITMTLPLINNAERIVFLITGREKLALLEKIADEQIQDSPAYPVTLVKARQELVWFTTPE